MLAIFLLGICFDVQALEFQFLNNYGQAIWVGIQGNIGKPTLNNGGFSLESGEMVSNFVIFYFIYFFIFHIHYVEY